VRTEPGRAAVFLDRDGTIIADRDYLADPRGVELLPGAAEGLRVLVRAGFLLVVVSNQSGVARGLFPESAIARVNRAVALALRRAAGVEIAGWYHCPHLPGAKVAAYDRTCDCRKPAPGLILRAARELSIDLGRSFAIGDRPRDCAAGRAAGLRGTVLIGKDAEEGAADHVASDLAAAARWIIER
jgi:D-glycero-D-manno-heptose 1,7-bisphosphate phosphatase